MTKERMIELVLLNQLQQYIQGLSEEDFNELANKYNISKLIDRSQELADDFLSDYVIDKGE